MIDYEMIEKKNTRKWQQMSAQEKQQEIEMLQKSRYFKLFSIIMLQKKLNELI